MILRTGSHRVPVEGTLPQSAAGIPDSGPVDYAGTRYEAFTLRARAFPDTALRVTLLVPASAGSALGCDAVRVAELGRIGRRVWQRFITVGAPVASYPRSLRSLTGALVYVRSGSRQIAGAPAPARRSCPRAAASATAARATAWSRSPLAAERARCASTS